MNILTLVIGLLMGGFCLLGAILNWNWFFNARKAAMIVKIFGRNGARIFYGALGVVIIAAAIFLVATGSLK